MLCYRQHGQKGKAMKITIYAKKKQTKDGKTYYIYLSSLTNKNTGETIPCRVKFRMDCGQPDPHTCPRIIEFDKKDGNMSASAYTTDEGETRISNTLWIARWKDCGEFVDTSLDDFE